MLGDDLNTPLGFHGDGPAPHRRLRVHPRVIWAGALVVLIGVGGFVLMSDDGRGGEPFVRVAIERPPPAAAPAVTVAAATPAVPPAQTTVAMKDPSSAASIEAQSGVKVVRGGGGQAPGALIIQLPDPVGINLTPAPDKRLVEKSKYGSLPKIGADGSRPVDVYGRPVFNASKLPAGAPRVVLVIGGMGLSADLTQSAIDKLPPAVTLAFAPYGNNLDAQAHAARDAGHELVLQVPMEPFDGSSDPGPHTLSTSYDADHNIDRLHWFMGRFTGYVGIANFLGGKFTANETAFTPILHEVASRGLLYLDDGSSPQSLTSTLVGAAGASWAQGDVTIDAVQTPEAVDAALLKLETIARQKGIAIGVGSDLPATLDRVSRFAAGLEGRGVALVPLSASIHQPTLAARNDPQPSP